MARTTLTRQEAMKRARERAAVSQEREHALLGYAADYEQAAQQIEDVFEGMQALGVRRSEIASRLGIPISRVPRPVTLEVDEELATGDTTGEVSDDGPQDDGTDRSGEQSDDSE